MASLQKQVRELQQALDDVIAGVYPQRNAFGPGVLKRAVLTAKSVSAAMLDVSDLQSVSSKTGSLNVDGQIKVAVGGSIASGLTAYLTDYTNAGFWIDNIGGPHVLIGSRQLSTSPRIDYNGSTLTVVGNIKATTIEAASGTFGGYNLGPDGLVLSDNSQGFKSSGAYRLWFGGTAGSTAKFYVDSAGNMTANNANLKGVTIDGASTFFGALSGATGTFAGSLSAATGTFSGTLSAAGGTFWGDISGASGTFWGGIQATTGKIGGIVIGASGLTAPGFALNASGFLSCNTVNLTGTINATAGTLSNLTVNGTITVNGGDLVLKSTGVWGDVIKWQYSGADAGSIYANASSLAMYRSSFGATGFLQLYNASARMGYGTNGWIEVDYNTVVRLGDNVGSYGFTVQSSTGASLFSVRSDASLAYYGPTNATALGAYVGYVPFWYGGTLRKLGVYA